MKMKNILLQLLVGLAVLLPVEMFSQVYRIDISGMIDKGLVYYVQRTIDDAEAANAKAVLVEVNTFGGLVAEATEIKDILLDSKVPTYAYVNKRAISAGALITLSCETIGMAPGSTIGAATVVDQQGQKAAEKMISYFRSEMGATAERYGRDRKIAEAMVDEEIEIEGISEKGKLITLTVEDALKYKMADYKAETLEEFLESVGLKEEQLVITEVTWAEDIVRFLTNPLVSSALMTLGLIGLLFEIKSPGWGIPGTLGLVCMTLFFGSHYIINLASSLEIILFFVGVALLILEVFVIPGFGVAGIAGIICIVGSLYMSLIGSFESVSMPDMTGAAMQVGLVLLSTIVIAGIMGKFLPKTGLWRWITLEPEFKKEAGYVASDDYSEYLGKIGTAQSTLRPAGIGEFGNKRLDVVTEGEFVEQDRPIKIIRVEGYRLIVRELEAGEK